MRFEIEKERERVRERVSERERKKREKARERARRVVQLPSDGASRLPSSSTSFIIGVFCATSRSEFHYQIHASFEFLHQRD